MADIKDRAHRRRARHKRVRRRITGTTEIPRLALFKSSQHTYVQLIDDSKGHTLASASTLNPEFRKEHGSLKPSEAAEKLGGLIAERAKAAGLSKVVFDRGGFPYRGRIQKLADAARAGGLEF